MAARKNLSHDQRTREKIKTSQLINRLTSFAEGKIELSPSQVRAIEVLLKKTIPDLAAIQLSGPEDGPIQTVTRVELIGVQPDGNG